MADATSTSINHEHSELVFPPMRVVKKPAFMRQLGLAARIKFGTNRQRTLALDKQTLLSFMKERVPGMENVPAETIEYLATYWANDMADSFEEGMQAGIENEREYRAQTRSSAAARAGALAASAGTAGIG